MGMCTVNMQRKPPPLEPFSFELSCGLMSVSEYASLPLGLLPRPFILLDSDFLKYTNVVALLFWVL